MSSPRRSYYFALTVLAPIILLFFVFTVLAAPSATVHTVCATGCDFSSIQAAINAAVPGDTINLSGETFTEPFTLDRNLTIEGAGAQATILQAATAPGIANSRVVTITAGVTATITGVTIRYGNISGGYPEGYGSGIFNLGALTLDHSDVISNSASYGGGIFTTKALTLTNSAIISNTAKQGAGIYNNSGINNYNFMNVSNSTFEGNTSDTVGGGIYNYNYTRLDVSDSTFRNNRAQDGGGIVNWRGVMTVTNSTFDSNTAAAPGVAPVDGDEGGAIWNYDGFSLATIVDSSFYNNDAFYGGAICNKNGADMIIVGSEFRFNGNVQSGGAINNKNPGSIVTISESLFSENLASHGGGISNYDYGRLIITDTTFSGNHVVGWGGGINNGSYAKSSIVRTTFDSNRAHYGGAISCKTGVEFEIANSTFSGNIAYTSGGALFLDNVSRGTATNVTIYGNSADDKGGGVYVHDYSGLDLSSSIIAGSLMGRDCYDETYAPVNDLGYNLIEDGTCLTESTSFTDNPQLGPLQDNGGSAHTHALLEDSPAIDAIPTGLCGVTEDQRGIKRPSGSGCDIGAYELISSYDIFLPLLAR